MAVLVLDVVVVRVESSADGAKLWTACIIVDNNANKSNVATTILNDDDGMMEDRVEINVEVLWMTRK